MGLRRGKVQSTSTGFYILPRADDKEASTHQEKRYVQKVEKYLSRSTTYLVMDSGAHVMRKEEKNHYSTNHTEKYRKRKYMRQICLYFFLAYTQKNSAIASGATPIRSAGRAPDWKKSTEGRWEIEANDKIGRQVV
jgi:hypothetical protein